MGQEGQPAAVASPQEALRLAVAALTAGRHDPRIADGAQANALESIAWSLIGLLASQQGGAAGKEGGLSMSEELRKLGFLQVGQR